MAPKRHFEINWPLTWPNPQKNRFEDRAKLKTPSEIFPPFKVTGFKQQLDWRPWREFVCGHYQPWKSGSQSQSVDRFAPRSSSQVKFMFSKKATKIDEIFTIDLTLCSKRQIDEEDFVNFRDLFRKYELYKAHTILRVIFSFLF